MSDLSARNKGKLAEYEMLHKLRRVTQLKSLLFCGAFELECERASIGVILREQPRFSFLTLICRSEQNVMH